MDVGRPTPDGQAGVRDDPGPSPATGGALRPGPSPTAADGAAPPKPAAPRPARPVMRPNPLTDTFVGTALTGGGIEPGRLGGGLAGLAAAPARPRTPVQPAAGLDQRELTGTATRVVGISIGIPEPFTTVLHRWRRSVGDPLADLVPPHVTLLPPTLVDAATMPEVYQHAADVVARHPAFELHLYGTGTFRPVSDVVFVSVAAGISQCELLAGELRTGPLESTPRFPYHPHVTVAQNVPDAQLDHAYTGLKHFDARFRVHLATVFEQDERGRWYPVMDCRLG